MPAFPSRAAWGNHVLLSEKENRDKTHPALASQPSTRRFSAILFASSSIHLLKCCLSLLLWQLGGRNRRVQKHQNDIFRYTDAETDFTNPQSDPSTPTLQPRRQPAFPAMFQAGIHCNSDMTVMPGATVVLDS